jgi:hypothetical protein
VNVRFQVVGAPAKCKIFLNLKISIFRRAATGPLELFVREDKNEFQRISLSHHSDAPFMNVGFIVPSCEGAVDLEFFIPRPKDKTEPPVEDLRSIGLGLSSLTATIVPDL